MAALVVDVGSWYQADRRLQTAADAAALAGVQELPRRSDSVQPDRAPLSDSQLNYRASRRRPSRFRRRRRSTSSPRRTPRNLRSGAQRGLRRRDRARRGAGKVFAPEQLKDVAPIAVYKARRASSRTRAASASRRPSRWSRTSSSTRRRASSACSTWTAQRRGAGDMKNWLEDGYLRLPPDQHRLSPRMGEERHQERARRRS